MARINIEDSIYSDNRFVNLAIALGSKRCALGAVFEAWQVAQQHVSAENPRALIPIEVWADQKCADELITTGLALIEGKFIYMRGAADQFNWLITRRANGAKGGRAKAKNRGQAPLALAKHGLALAKQNVPSYSYSYSRTKKEEEAQTSVCSPPPRIDNEVITLDPVSSSRTYDARFDPRIADIISYLGQLFRREPSHRVKLLAPRILARFGDPEEFGQWCEELANAPKTPDPADRESDYRRYCDVALSRVLRGEG